MSDQSKKGPGDEPGRRLFLEKAGRFAAVTPPAVALMLSAAGKARAATGSGHTTTLTTTSDITTTVTTTSDITTTVTVTTSIGPE